jgi:hypothetical protein
MVKKKSKGAKPKKVSKKKSVPRKISPKKQKTRKAVQKKIDPEAAEEKKLDKEITKIENEIEKLETQVNGQSELYLPPQVHASKPIAQIKKGDVIKIDGVSYEVNSHDVLIDHGTTKEMAIEIFNPSTNKDYQIRYFDDQMETTLELYELQEIMYLKKPMKKVEW